MVVMDMDVVDTKTNTKTQTKTNTKTDLGRSRQIWADLTLLTFEMVDI